MVASWLNHTSVASLYRPRPCRPCHSRFFLNDPGSDPAGPLDCPPKKFLGWKGCMRGRGPCTMKACEHIAALLHISLLTFAEYYNANIAVDINVMTPFLW